MAYLNAIIVISSRTFLTKELIDMDNERQFKIEAQDNPEFCGILPIHSDIKVISADECKTVKLGWVVYEEVGESFITKSAMNILNGHKRVKHVLFE
jgi:hypothetical protein